MLIEETPGDSPCDMIRERMSRAGMERRFPDEWIYAIDPEVDQCSRIIGGTVICHSKDRDKVDDVASQFPSEDMAMFFTAVTPSDEMVAL